MVIFGAGGDLAKRLLAPALCNLAEGGGLDEAFKVLGVDHKAKGDAAFADGLGAFLRGPGADGEGTSRPTKAAAAAWKWLEERLFYQAGEFEDPATYSALAARLEALGGEGGGNVLFYLAVAPRFFGDIVERLAAAGLTREANARFRRVVIEKPFGTDLASAKALNARVGKCLDEHQVYRIDHFLGKETVRNILVTRFANGVFEPVWNRLHIDHVQITASETVGVEGRGGYYDRAGALRDMVPSHLFQLLAMTAMETPNTFEADAVRAEKARVVEAVQLQSLSEASANSVRGQYRVGRVNGREVADYRHEPRVAARSHTETYVALKFTIDNWRWAGVPFYLRTGKALAARDTSVAIRFRRAPGHLFGPVAGPPAANTLILQIQPHEGVSLAFEAKRPGPDVELAPVRMDFRYADYFAAAPANGYETLLYDAMIGDPTQFAGAREIEFAWRAVEPFLQVGQDAGKVHGYAAGSAGPRQADDLMARDGRAWRPIG
ncbi:MAG TPA: glucose-6-phosphate dehydrogenase [Phenylobacterium sp.]|uniref:glucose-6-phosphate dehydrogenase n=1 Tax=Phenylobacterium sp. TaxID=1871053 RepID=UPI002CDF220B|nr:glucose-6-phosphate dehydrogenase [Phenylobacterium sp.]HSV03252.1 glucose-6-phosphate dehydrogenase [Phenylobacterium sp.]